MHHSKLMHTRKEQVERTRPSRYTYFNMSVFVNATKIFHQVLHILIRFSDFKQFKIIKMISSYSLNIKYCYSKTKNGLDYKSLTITCKTCLIYVENLNFKIRIEVCGTCRQPIVSYTFSLNKYQQMHVLNTRRLSFTGFKVLLFPLILQHSTYLKRETNSNNNNGET